MSTAHATYDIQPKKEKDLQTLVENRTAYTFDRCELNIFETHQVAENVKLRFNDFVFTSMIRGKKVMHLPQQEAFDYLPGESVIVAPNELMQIDFPEAKLNEPTQCIALAISEDLIEFTIDYLNRKYPKVDLSSLEWSIDHNINHISNSQGLMGTINRILQISSNQDERNKDLYVDLAIQEMVLRLMQTQARTIFEQQLGNQLSTDPLSHTVEIIRNNMREKIEIDKLARAAGMSRAKYYQEFKNAFGYTPAQFILNEKISCAKRLLKATDLTISEVAAEAGFDNLSYFSRVFKEQVKMSPKQFSRSA